MRKTQLLDEIMREAGFRERMTGTAMVREAIIGYAPGQRMTKDIYPTIARAHNTTASCCERNMRAAVCAAFRGHRCSPEARKYFHLPEGEAPTVGEAIARLHRVWVINAEVEGAD